MIVKTLSVKHSGVETHLDFQLQAFSAKRSLTDANANGLINQKRSHVEQNPENLP